VVRRNVKVNACKLASHHSGFLLLWVTGELSTLRQLMKVPNEPGLSPNNGLENVSLSDQSMASNPRKRQAKCHGAKTTSHDGRAGHVMTHMCHPSKARRMASVTIQVPTQKKGMVPAFGRSFANLHRLAHRLQR